MIELLTSAEMGEADRLTIAAGTPSIELMENAGLAIADHVGERHPRPCRVTVVAGPGNNGGDGFVAARILAERGYAIRLLPLAEVGRLKGDAALAARRWADAAQRVGDAVQAALWGGAPQAAIPDAVSPADAIIDALFGAGLDRPVEGLARAMIAAINAARCPVYAVDLPSGVNGTTGAVMGAAVDATETVTFFRRKPGHLLLPGRLHCGRIAIADIGISARVFDEITPRTFANVPALWGKDFPLPRIDGHKYTRGHAVVVSGGISSTGAARLAAHGALRAGAGLVTIASPRAALVVNAAASLAVMVRPVDGARELAEFLADARRNVVVLGPGGGVGEAMREQVLAALAGERAVVLDADALTSFADTAPALTSAIRARTGATILTPHDGEFRRLFKSLAEIPHSKLEAARAAAREAGGIVLLKGPDTVVAAPDGRAAVADNAPPFLATAGSGDVLAGIIAGLLAQGMPAFEAAAAALWLHGEAATEFGPGLIAEDLPDALPKVYRRLFAELQSITSSARQ
jgi:ADP-dependent NAD(P)H-hydrate dehydratase / NAD(P)H-hydrate epimerase